MIYDGKNIFSQRELLLIGCRIDAFGPNAISVQSIQINFLNKHLLYLFRFKRLNIYIGNIMWKTFGFLMRHVHRSLL